MLPGGLELPTHQLHNVINIHSINHWANRACNLGNINSICYRRKAHGTKKENVWHVGWGRPGSDHFLYYVYAKCWNHRTQRHQEIHRTSFLELQVSIEKISCAFQKKLQDLGLGIYSTTMAITSSSAVNNGRNLAVLGDFQFPLPSNSESANLQAKTPTMATTIVV